jgi:hypothetical protein
MKKSDYIERICRELSNRSSHEEAAHSAYLLGIFDHVKDLPSPEREETLVRMLTGLHFEDRNPDAPQAAA